MKSKFYIAARFCLGWLAKLIFLLSFKGRENEPTEEEGPYLVCSNHISMVDPIFICAALSRQQPRFMAKAELFKVPGLSWLIRNLGAFPVERNGADAGVLKKSIKMLEDGYCVGMFPQGTRRKGVDPKTTPVKAGAGLISSRAKAQVLPVYIKVKNNKVAFLRPVKIIVGKPISYDEYTRGGELEGKNKEITQYIFDRICELSGDSTGTENNNE